MKIKELFDFEFLTCSQLRNYLISHGFGCLAGSKLKKKDLLRNAQYIFYKFNEEYFENLLKECEND